MNKDPKEFLDGYAVNIRKLQDERGLNAGDRALKGSVGREIKSAERVANYMEWQVVKRLKVKPR